MRIVTTAHSASAPVNATRKVNTAVPPHHAAGSHGASAWLNASLPHGQPPKGTRSRNASCPTHTAATQTGHPRRRVTAVVAKPTSAIHNAE